MTKEEIERYEEIKSRCETESLSKIQQDYPVPKGTLARVRDGHVVVKPELRYALKLPLYISVIPCVSCGKAHSYRPKECQLPFADRIPADEPQRQEILTLVKIMMELQ